MSFPYYPVEYNKLEQNGMKPPVSLTLTPFDFDEMDQSFGSDWLNLHIWAYNRKSKMNLARIENFSPCICLKLNKESYFVAGETPGQGYNPIYQRNSFDVNWDEDLVSKLFSNFCQKLKRKGKNEPLSYYFGYYHSIYFFTKHKEPYLYVYFKSLEDKKTFKTICTKYHIYLDKDHEYITVEVNEEKVNTTRRLMSRQDLKYNCWFTVDAVEVLPHSDYRISKNNNKEYFIDFKSMVQIDPKICSGWKVNPRLVGMDIEDYSHKGIKRFPDQTCIKDPVYIISVDFKIAGIKESRKKYSLVYGNIDTSQFENAIVFKREIDLLFAYVYLIDYLDPDLILSYNGYKHDEPYIIGRFEIHGISVEHIPNFGRLKNVKTEIYDRRWNSSGRGQVVTTFMKPKGRLVVDELPNMKAMYKLRKYSLDFVSAKYLGYKKLGVTVAQMFDAFKDFLEEKETAREKMTEVVKYCERDSELTIDLFENRQMWEHIRALSGEGGIPMPDVYLKGEQCRCYSQLYNECMNNGYILSDSKHYDYFYSGGFVGNPIPGVYEFVFTLDFTSLYPSIIRAYNLCWRTFVPIHLWPSVNIEDCNVIKVVQDEPTKHFSISRKLDIEAKIKLKATGYPVDITEEEYKYIERDMYVQSKQDNKENNNENVNDEIDETDPILVDEKEKTERHYEFRFVKKHILEGFLPKLETEWCGSRKIVKNKIKKLNKELIYRENHLFLLKQEKDKAIEKLNSNIENLEERAEAVDAELEELEGELERIEAMVADLKNEKKVLKIQDKMGKLTEELDDLSEKHEVLTNILDLKSDETLNKDKIKDEVSKITKRVEEIISEMNIYDKTQLAIKIVANSGYGFTGVREGMLSGVFIAICVTFLGRQSTQHANVVLEENFKHLGGKIVYNDTDSSMLKLDITDPYQVKELGEQMELIINGRPEKRDEDDNIIEEAIEPVFRDPLKMEFEDCCQMCPIKPKFYFKALRNIEHDDIDKYGPFELDKAGNRVVKKKGVLTAKRGNSVFAMNVYQDLADRVVFLVDIVSSLNSLRGHVEKLLTDGYDGRELTKVTELGSEYKAENYYMDVFSKNLAEWGKPVKPGDRIEYLIVRTWEEVENPKLKLNVGHKCREIEMWEEDDNRERIDYEYYVEKGLQTQYDDLFSVGYKKITEDPIMKDKGYKPKFSNCHFVHMRNPIKMLGAMVKDFMRAPEDKFKKYFLSNFELDEDQEYDPDIPRNFYAAALVDHELSEIIDYIKENFDIPEESEAVSQ